jgi:hypothetical protein
MSDKLTPEQIDQMKRVKSYFPYRIIWSEINKETKEFSCFGSYTKRAMNASARKGNAVFYSRIAIDLDPLRVILPA